MAGGCCVQLVTMPRRVAPASAWQSGTRMASRWRRGCSRSHCSVELAKTDAASQSWGMAQSTIWTIGYEHSTVDDVISALREADTEVLADIRYLPLSRRPGFSKSALAAAAREAGI